MSLTFRLIDSGVRNGREQIAFDQALIELHRAGKVPDTVRFLQFPPTALVGRHQSLSGEVKVAHCRAHGIGLVRRMTGGGALYMDEKQLGWELVLSRKRLPLPGLADYTRAICEAVAHGLSETFGIAAKYRPRNDIEVDGRKLCGTGGFFDGDTLIYQGTTLVDLEPADMLAALNVPEAKLKKRDIDDAGQRVVTLRELLGAAPDMADVRRAVVAGLEARLGIVTTPSAISDEEFALTRKLHDEEIGKDEFVHEIDTPLGGGNDVLKAAHTGAGGTVTAFVRLEGVGAARRIREVLLTGDFFVTPPRMVYDLEAALRGVLVGDAGAAAASFFQTSKPDLLTIAPADFQGVVEAAIARDPLQST